jgi:hypothetical protein
LLTGIAVASILGRGSVPTASYADLGRDAGETAVAVMRNPVSNSSGKKDKLSVAAARMGSASPADSSADPVIEPLRQAFAADTPLPAPGSTVLPPAMVTQPAARPRIAAKPPVQKTYTLLSDAQIAAIKGRLNLTASQESYWPDIETALRAIARKMHDTRQANPVAGAPPIDPESAEVQQLKSAAMPLLFQLREDQKREVRALARIIGLEQVASAI